MKSTTSSTAMGLGVRHRRVRKLVLERDNYTCHWCGAPANTCDELVARAEGGVSSLENSVAACGPCNSRRGGQLGAARRRRNTNPRRHPFFEPSDRDAPGVPALSPATPNRSLSSQ